jgi:hypothetical protein
MNLQRWTARERRKIAPINLRRCAAAPIEGAGQRRCLERMFGERDTVAPSGPGVRDPVRDGATECDPGPG